MATRRVRPDIREIQVESDEQAIFRAARREDIGVRGSTEPFGAGSFHIVSKVTQRRLDPPREILIQLEAKRHAMILRGHRNDSLACQFGGVAHSRRDVL